MSCTSCTSNKKGCQNRGNCANGCDTSTVVDWLTNIVNPVEKSNYAEIQFKNNRSELGVTETDIGLRPGDLVVIDLDKGNYDIGTVRFTGELARVSYRQLSLQAQKNAVLNIKRRANQKEIDKWQELQAKEKEFLPKARIISDRLRIQMKISDLEFRADGLKVTVYYTSDGRIDFRQLIKEYAYVFRTKIEMKQIGSRQEGGMIGGLGSCGRELCCSTWLKDLRSVNTSAARYQQLSLNPQKLTGQCGKLKCCLNYELDNYVKALKHFPNREVKLKTKAGVAVFQKLNVFKEEVWYTYQDNPSVWHKLSLEDAQHITSQNKQGKIPASLEDFAIRTEEEESLFGGDLTSDINPNRNRRNNRRNNRRKKRDKKTDEKDKG